MISLSRSCLYAASGLLPVALVLSTGEPARTGPNGHFHPADFPNAVLRTHEGKEVRFKDDLLKGKVAVLNFFYTRCEGVCPGTVKNLLEVQRILGDRVGRDLFLYSITLRPEEDTPERMRAYAEGIGAGPGWLFLTGEPDVVEGLRRGLGFVDPDPEVDKDKSQHVGMVLYGNEARQSWAACPGGSSPELMAEQILWMLPQAEAEAAGGGPKDRGLPSLQGGTK
ncbi:MAG: SCO family protein [Planctomycetota bacterium]